MDDGDEQGILITITQQKIISIFINLNVLSENSEEVNYYLYDGWIRREEVLSSNIALEFR